METTHPAKPRRQAPLRLSAADTSWSAIIGLQRANGEFVNVVYHQQEADRFDVKDPGAKSELPTYGRAEGRGVQVQLGDRWY